MQWRGRRMSGNVEDRRGRGMRGLPIGMGGGLGTIILLLVMMFFGINPAVLFRDAGGPAPTEQRSGPPQDELAQFVSVVLADTEDVWNTLFRRMGREYEEPRLVLFSGQVASACGFASAASGPFYCPGDSKLYIDLSFYRELRDRLGAPGDFAQAYVIAHEVGHHVQNLMGISDRVHQARNRVNREEYNQLSIRLELQADFLAGVWAHHAQRAKRILETGDIEEGMRAAAAVGDDRLQRQSQGYVVPESFTHGTSEQRVRWFRRGLESGDIAQGNTFEAQQL